jgi:uncharacterized protein (DUF4415 family)
MNEKNTGIVTMRLDLNNPQPLTEEEQDQLRRLRSMTDEDIDFSDIPRTAADAKWIQRGRLVGATSPEVVAIDADLLEHFGTGGAADAVKVNAALREYMKAHEKAS